MAIDRGLRQFTRCRLTGITGDGSITIDVDWSSRLARRRGQLGRKRPQERLDVGDQADRLERAAVARAWSRSPG